MGGPPRDSSGNRFARRARAAGYLETSLGWLCLGTRSQDDARVIDFGRSGSPAPFGSPGVLPELPGLPEHPAISTPGRTCSH